MDSIEKLVYSPIEAAAWLEALAALLRSLDAFVVGNDAVGKSGITGLVDEIRFSSKVRTFYVCDLAWPRPAQITPITRVSCELPASFFELPASFIGLPPADLSVPISG